MFNPFENDKDVMKKALKGLKCPVHGKASKVIFDYNRDETIAYPHITKCCCNDFANIVAKTLYETRRCEVVYLEHETGLTSSTIIIEEDSLS